MTDPNANAPDALTITLSGNGAGGHAERERPQRRPERHLHACDGHGGHRHGRTRTLVFTPDAGPPNTETTTTFTLTDQTELQIGTIGSRAERQRHHDFGDRHRPGGRADLSGTHATATTSEASVTPFSGVTLADPNAGATDTLTIALSGKGGTLSGSGLTKTGATTYSLATGTAAQVTALLDALTFTPAAGAPHTQSTTGFTLSDASSAGTGTSNAGTSVMDTDPAVAPTLSGTHATATTSEASVTPFSGVTLADPNAGRPTR